ncbi:hypothetical protein LX36DRAFT_14549 [Colletotrichum falcatum]|nr:hypothetical protein LX36DRAFT_14549 [Colletotrichum falcatum]
MGRTSKFTFPMPGRKQKEPFGPIVSGPMSKAQKILGIAEINIDAPRQWDTASASGISVSVSESTATYNASEMTRGLRHDDGASSCRNPQWEQESEIVPACLASRFSQLNTAGEFTETSSLTRRGSNSTITSWYDKSKMPLSISQQTSSSAMAKGLPPKANAVLDIEGKESNHLASSDDPKARKRPSRLDLGPLLALHKHHSLRGKTESQQVARESRRQPSLTSLASLPQLERTPSIPQRAQRKLTRRSTLDSIKSMGGRPRAGSSSRRGANDISTLPNLYEHYEQMTFDSALGHDGHDGPLAASDPSLDPAGQTRLRSSSTADQKKNAPRPPPRPPIQYEATSPTTEDHVGAFPEPPRPTGQYQQMQAADRDCASSVSSRYTKTSRASKRTSHSIVESDLMEKSVLSLSSDSEEDGLTDSVSKFTESRGSDASSLGPSSLRSANSRDAPSSVAKSSRRSTKHTGFASTVDYLGIPSKAPPAQPPVNYPTRMSSLPATAYKPPAASNRLSRHSTNSSSTTRSSGDRPARPAYGGAQETRASSVPPPAEFYAPPVRVEQPQRMLAAKSSSARSVDQPTPPISPTSTKASIPAEPSADTPSETDARFMAVTRQEEMLLAALRMKRARMRESILAEYDGEMRSASPQHYQQQQQQQQHQHQYQHQHQQHRHHERNSSQTTITEMKWPEPPQTLRHQTSANSNSTIRAGSRSSSSRPGSTAPDKKHQRSSSSRYPEPVAPDPRLAPRSASRASGARRMVPVQEAAAAPAEAKRERVLLYLDRPVGHVSSMDLAEPSPDLSDYMDFENGSETEDEPSFSGDVSFFRSPEAARHGAASRNRGRVLRTEERSRHESSPLRPKGDHASSPAAKERVRAPVVDAGAHRSTGVPRPDSPVSPEDSMGLSTKGLSRRKAVRLSAVGSSGAEAVYWGDDS